MFKCDCCGCCCRSVALSSIYRWLDRGDGVCKYFDEQSLLCTIYDDRPIECNVDLMYEVYLSKMMCRDEYYEKNYKICNELKNKFSATK